MAAGQGVWGIDIGQCAIKALRCELHEDGHTLLATNFDFIEYPKILSQPEAEPAALISDALAQFLSRNELKEDKVAVSVSGQSGLARFFKPPPVEAKKIDDIVQYEARQQIPFALEDVVYEYQQMPGATIEDGIALDTEIGLFAMKREHVFRALRPFELAEVDIDYVQLSPLALYNYAAHDLFPADFDKEEFDSDAPPESIVLLSIGTDSTDLVVTNGYRMWQRPIPLGGNHFTKQLTKELKLTFAKAEHLKRNARQAEDPRTVFKAMRPVFSDLVTEVQRSLSYFQNLDRKARLGKIIAVGNAIKLPGLQQYLAKNLEREVELIDGFHKLAGSSVVSAPTFAENRFAFPVSYGLCVQALGKSKLYTNLLPREIATARVIKGKKPWVVAILATLLIGILGNVALTWRAWSSVRPERYSEVASAISGAETLSGDYDRIDQEQQQKIGDLQATGELVVGTTERRLLWPELLKAINYALPYDPELQGADYWQTPLMQRPTIYVESIKCERYADLKDWFTPDRKKKYQDGLPPELKEKEEQAEAPPADSTGAAAPGVTPAVYAAATEETAEGPTGPGWVISVQARHYHNADRLNRTEQYVRKTFLKNLHLSKIRLPVEPGTYEQFSMEDLGIQYPLIDEATQNPGVPNPRLQDMERTESRVREESETTGGAAARPPAKDDDRQSKLPRTVDAFTFTVQFAWQEKPMTERLADRETAPVRTEAPSPAPPTPGP